MRILSILTESKTNISDVDLIKNMEFWKLLNYILLISLAAFVILGVLLIGENFENSNLSEKINQTYQKEILPKSSEELALVLNKINNTNSDEEKIKIISNYVQTDFVWSLHNSSFKPEDKFNFILERLFFKDFHDHHIYIDQYGHRVIRSGEFANNPYVIAYYKAGSCGEHATLAQYLTNLSGFESRIVEDPSGYHAWIEIAKGNEWYFYDPTFNTNNNPIGSWFAPTASRMNNTVIASAARVFCGNEDITHHYPPYGSLTIHGIKEKDQISLSWVEDQKYSYLIPTNSSEISLNLTTKKYQMEVNRDSFNKFSMNIEIEANETTIIDIS